MVSTEKEVFVLHNLRQNLKSTKDAEEKAIDGKILRIMKRASFELYLEARDEDSGDVANVILKQEGIPQIVNRDKLEEFDNLITKIDLAGGNNGETQA